MHLRCNLHSGGGPTGGPSLDAHDVHCTHPPRSWAGRSSTSPVLWALGGRLWPPWCSIRRGRCTITYHSGSSRPQYWHPHPPGRLQSLPPLLHSTGCYHTPRGAFCTPLHHLPSGTTTHGPGVSHAPCPCTRPCTSSCSCPCTHSCPCPYSPSRSTPRGALSTPPSPSSRCPLEVHCWSSP